MDETQFAEWIGRKSESEDVVAPRLVDEVFKRREVRIAELEDAEKLGSAAFELLRERKGKLPQRR